MICTPRPEDVEALIRQLERDYPTIEFDFDFVETIDHVAEIRGLIDETLADPTVEHIESACMGAITFRLTQEEVERRKAADAEMGTLPWHKTKC